MTTYHGESSSTSPNERPEAHLTAVAFSASVCVVLDVVAAYAVILSFLMSPRGPWDDDVLTAVQVSSSAGGALAARRAPVSRGWLRWWLLLPAVLSASAVLRFVQVDLSCPI